MAVKIWYHGLLDDVLDAASSDLLCSSLVVNSSLGPSSFQRLAPTLQQFMFLLHSSLALEAHPKSKRPFPIVTTSAKLSVCRVAEVHRQSEWRKRVRGI
jgi:hypothetical protein